MINDYLKLVTEATNENNHTHARKLIAMYVREKHGMLQGIYKLEKAVDALATLQDFYKYTPEFLFNVRKDIENAIFSFLDEKETTAFYNCL